MVEAGINIKVFEVPKRPRTAPGVVHSTPGCNLKEDTLIAGGLLKTGNSVAPKASRLAVFRRPLTYGGVEIGERSRRMPVRQGRVSRSDGSAKSPCVRAAAPAPCGGRD